MRLETRHLNNKDKEPLCMSHIVHIRKGTLKFTVISKTAEYLT